MLSASPFPFSFAGNGSTTAFPLTSGKFLANADLRVYLVDDATGVPTLQTLTTHYTVTGAGSETGGTVTFVTAPASGKTVYIDRWVDITQAVDFVENEALPAATLENALDRITMWGQQLASRAGGVSYDIAASGSIQFLTGSLLAWDADDKLLSNLADPVSDQDAATKAYVDDVATTNVPVPDNPGQNGYYLTASGGTFDWTALPTLMGLSGGNWTATSLQIKNLAPGTAATDAVTKAQLDAVSSATGSVPTPIDPGDDGKPLVASGGIYGWALAAVNVASGGTGATTAAAARTNLGLGTIATQAASAVAITGGTVVGITDLAVADGGTGASTAANARTNLGLGTAAVLDVGTGASQVVQLTAAGKYPAVDGSLITNIASSVGAGNVVLLQDQKTSGTAGGTFTQGAWQTRTLQTEVNDSGGLCSLASNQFTLTAGTYAVYAAAAANKCGEHRIRIYNATDSTVLVQGVNAAASSGTNDGVPATLLGLFTVGASKALELQHYCANTKSTDGYGVAVSATGVVEVYASVMLLRVA